MHQTGVVLPTASPRVHKPVGGLSFTSANTQQCKVSFHLMSHPMTHPMHLSHPMHLTHPMHLSHPMHLTHPMHLSHPMQALRVWGGKPTHIDHTIPPEPALPRRDTISNIDPDALKAYNYIMAQRALPMTVSVPNVPGLDKAAQKQHFLEFDEHVLDRMAKLGWDRSHGVAKLMPLACALYEHWKVRLGTA